MSVNIFKNNALTKIANGLKNSVVTITNNLLATTSGTALDAVQGKVLDDKITELNNSLTADNAQAFQFAYDSTTQKYGYKVKEADTDVFVPFNSTVLEYIPISGLTNGKRVSTNGLPHFVAMCFGTSLTSLSQYLLYSDGIYCQELSVSRSNSSSLSDIDETGFTFKTTNSGTFTGHLFVLY